MLAPAQRLFKSDWKAARIASGRKRHPAWCAGRGSGIPLREQQALLGQTVDGGRFYVSRTIDADIGGTEIVRHNENYVRARVGQFGVSEEGSSGNSARQSLDEDASLDHSSPAPVTAMRYLTDQPRRCHLQFEGGLSHPSIPSQKMKKLACSHGTMRGCENKPASSPIRRRILPSRRIPVDALGHSAACPFPPTTGCCRRYNRPCR